MVHWPMLFRLILPSLSCPYELLFTNNRGVKSTLVSLGYPKISGLLESVRAEASSKADKDPLETFDDMKHQRTIIIPVSMHYVSTQGQFLVDVRILQDIEKIFYGLG